VAAIQFSLLRRVFGMNFALLLSFHGMDIVQAIATKGLHRWLWRLVLLSADVVVACSNALSNQIASFEPRIRTKIATIHNGVDIDSIVSARDLTYELDEKLRQRPFILSVASFERKKGLDVLIRAFASLRPSMPRLALVLVGAEREASEELRALVGELSLSESVFFFGDVAHSRLHAFYSTATLFCLPSRVEPFGIVLLEAGVFGRAVVATAVGGIPEIITNGVTGRLVPPEDEAMLAKELRDLLSNPDERLRLGQSLRVDVAERFTWSRALRSYLELAHLHSASVMA
jgi:starch synthase